MRECAPSTPEKERLADVEAGGSRRNAGPRTVFGPATMGLVYKKHPVFTPPRNLDATIWRYTDFAKFVSLISRDALYFSRLDHLGDDLEGSVTAENVRRRPHIYGEHFEKLVPQLAQIIRESRKTTWVNCWHMAEYESAALWATYAGKGGLAIRSTFRKLCEAIDAPEDVFVGRVRYIDYDTDVIPENNSMAPSMFKRKSFEHEREVRAAVVQFPTQERRETAPVGLYVPVDVQQLVVAIHVSPVAAPWLQEVVANVVEQYGLELPVVHSDLNRAPVY